MGNVGFNSGVAKYGNSFSSLRSTRHKRRLKALEKGHCFVYFIQAENGMVKIGYSARLQQRWLNLQASNPMGLTMLVYVQGDSVAEERLHTAFADCRQLGEWFSPTPALMAYIAELKAAVDWFEFRA